MMILLFGPAQPRDPVGQWLKQTGKCDTAHYIIWRHGDELRTGCQMMMDANHVYRPALGARLCENCICDLLAKEKHARKTCKRR